MMIRSRSEAVNPLRPPSNCLLTTDSALPRSRSSSVSPTQTIAVSPATIAAIWNAAESTDSPRALAAGVGGNGTLEDLWHLFSEDAWNDHADSFHDDFDGYDDLKDGIKAAFGDADGGRLNRGDPSTKARLEGEQTRQFELLQGASQIQRLSFLYDYVKFDDPAVRYIRYEAPITSAQGSEFELTNMR